MNYLVQPRETVPPLDAQVRQEIAKFLEAVNSYADRVAREPRISFQQHLSSFFAPVRDSQREIPAQRR